VGEDEVKGQGTQSAYALKHPYRISVVFNRQAQHPTDGTTCNQEGPYQTQEGPFAAASPTQCPHHIFPIPMVDTGVPEEGLNDGGAAP